MKTIIKYIILFMAFIGLSNVQAQTGWTINSSNYQYNMSVTALPLIHCETQNNPNNQIGAFINGQLAGYAYVDVDVSGQKLAYLTIYSNVSAGDTIRYKLYDADADQILDAKYFSLFEENGSIGNAQSPLKVKTDYELVKITRTSSMIFEYYQTGDSVCSFTTFNETNTQASGISYSFINDADGIDNSKFTISNNTLLMNEDVDFLTQDSYQVHIAATTALGCAMDSIFVFSVINTNDPPTDILTSPSFIDENLPAGTLICDLEAVDASISDSHTFELVGESSIWTDNSKVEIQGNKLVSALSYDYEMQDSLHLQIKVTDQVGNFYVDTFLVVVNDVIEYDDLKANNVITPNNDGFNDVFFIPNIDLFSTFKLFIYNENGNILYEAKPYNNDWRGQTNDGKELKSGSYYYYFGDTTTLLNENKFTGIISIVKN